MNKNKFRYYTTYVDGSASTVNNKMCNDESATHVIIETTYGCNTMLQFTKTNSSDFKQQKLQAGFAFNL